MKHALRLVALALLAVLPAACAAGAGVWSGSAASLDAAAMRTEIEKSLRDRQWVLVGSSTGVLAVKPNGGGHKSIASFQIAGGRSGGSSFVLTGKSGHEVNWLTFGILGFSMKRRAYHDLASWYDEWVKNHPAQSN